MRIGVFCSGGDAPGMNPCVRAVVRSAIPAGHEVIGIMRGYQGLLDEDFFLNRQGEARMTLRSVSDISKLGGTILRSSRSDEFRTPEGQAKAKANLERHGIDALIPIGGDGTLRGAAALLKQWPGKIIACPGTIDNDLIGTDATIGFATAVDTAVEAVDKIRDTAASHERMFLIEVMGRHSGYIAVYTAIAVGSETVCIPETPTDIDQLITHLHVLRDRGKTSVMMIVAEGDEAGGALAMNEKMVAANCPFPTRVAVLGHLQRGGSPVAADRILASRLGDFAVKSLDHGKTGALAGVLKGKCQLTPFEQTYAGHKPIPQELLSLIETLSQ